MLVCWFGKKKKTGIRGEEKSDRPTTEKFEIFFGAIAPFFIFPSPFFAHRLFFFFFDFFFLKIESEKFVWIPSTRPVLGDG